MGQPETITSLVDLKPKSSGSPTVVSPIMVLPSLVQDTPLLKIVGLVKILQVMVTLVVVSGSGLVGLVVRVIIGGTGESRE